MEKFKNAVNDYRYLQNNQYSNKSSLKLVGDRYKLTHIQRNCLFRGVFPNIIAEKRKTKIISSKTVNNKNLGIDWYNVLISIETYLKGMLVFIADDGILRDVSEVHGSYKKGKVTVRAINLIIEEIFLLKAGMLFIFLDSPIAFSGEMAELLRDRLKSLKNLDISVVRSADYMLINFDGIVCSSDSIIMNNVDYIFDFPRYIIEKNFKVEIPDITSLKF